MVDDDPGTFNTRLLMLSTLDVISSPIGLRILHLPSPFQGIREPVRFRIVFTGLFLALSRPNGGQGSSHYHLQPHHRRIRRRSHRYAAQKELVLAR